MPATRDYDMSGKLELSIDGFSVAIDRFVNQEYPRLTVEGNASMSYTASGVAVGGGSIREAYYLFDVSGWVGQSEREQLQLIWAEHDRRRRLSQNCNILVTDTTQYHEERLPRTRAIAPGTAPKNFPENNPSHCLYYAQFFCWMIQRPVFSERWNEWTATFTLQETDKVPPV
jgi:hypothetical protein